MVPASTERFSPGAFDSNAATEPEEHNITRTELLIVRTKVESESLVHLMVTGRMTANGIGDLRRAVEDGRQRRKIVILDMSEVTLLDRVSAEFLNGLSSQHVRFENCPEYLRPWIAGLK